MPADPTPIKIGNFYPPQYKNAITGVYEELTGSNGSYNAQTVSYVVEDSFSDTTSITKVFDEAMHGIVISNDHTADLTLTIHGKSRVVKGGKLVEGKVVGAEYYEGYFKPFDTVIITASGPWRAESLQQYGAAAAVIVPEPPDTTAPDNVTNLAYNNVTQNSATLTWDASASSDTVGYEIWRAGALLASVDGLMYDATGMTASTQYTYTIKAKDGAGNIASGTSINVTTIAQPADATPPNNVTGLDNSNVTQTGVTLSWVASDSSDIKDYRIYNGSTLIATVTALTYAVTGLTADTDNVLTVKARDTSNNEASGVSVTVRTLAPADTTVPVLTITPAATFTDTQLVTMSVNEPADIFYSLDGSAPVTKYTTALTLTDTTTVKAMARDTAGNESAVQTITYTFSPANSPGQIIVSDTFTASDGTDLAGRLTETGNKTWEALVGGWSIGGNAAYKSGNGSNAGDGNAILAVDTGVSDKISLQFKHTVKGNYTTAMVRLVDTSNYISVIAQPAAYEVWKKVNGTLTKIGTLTGVSTAAGDVINVRLDGSNIYVKINALADQAFSATEFSTATKVAVGTFSETARIDDFKVTFNG